MRKDIAAVLAALALAGGAGWLLVYFGAGWWALLGGLLAFGTVFNTIAESTAYKQSGKPAAPEPEEEEGGSE